MLCGSSAIISSLRNSNGEIEVSDNYPYGASITTQNSNSGCSLTDSNTTIRPSPSRHHRHRLRAARTSISLPRSRINAPQCSATCAISVRHKVASHRHKICLQPPELISSHCAHPLPMRTEGARSTADSEAFRRPWHLGLLLVTRLSPWDKIK